MNEIYRKPNRLKYYNYSNAGFYFITICTYERQKLFGEVVNGNIELNETGMIVEKYLLEIPLIYKNIDLDEYIVMPNHEHIILINNRDEEYRDRSKMIISKIIQQYKFVCTREIRKLCNNKQHIWQRSFYDRIIRNEYELENIRKYIKMNPSKWEQEKQNPENLLM